MSHDHRGHRHDHGHGGDGHTHGSGLRGAIAELFRPHSHDAADSVDTALEASERGLRAVKISFAALMVTALLQVLVIAGDGVGGVAGRHDPQLLRRA